MENNFFATQTPSSRTKAIIIADYFPQYCRIIHRKKPQKEFRYVDLFAGPGKYEDGKISTPLLLGDAIAKDIELKKLVHFIFNDENFSKELKKNFHERFPEGTFAFKPKFGAETVGKSKRILDYLTKNVDSEVNPEPTLLFIDPWGYKGIDTLALSKFLTNWGNELFLFLNTKRVNAATVNDKFDDSMQMLFPTKIETIRKERLYKASVNERIKLIIDNLTQEFQQAVNKTLYTTAFRFIEEDSIGTSHYIIHFTKHQRGYELVKQVYYDYDNVGAPLINGFYTFDAKKMGLPNTNNMMFGDSNIESLADDLYKKYKGKTVTAQELYEEHHPTAKATWCATHYAQTLREMVRRGLINSSYTDNVAHRVSVLITNYCKLKFK